MTTIRARLAPGRSIDTSDFTDITSTPVEAVEFDPDGSIAVTFARELTQDETDAARARITAADTEAETLLVQAAKAYRANVTYLGNTTPTNAEIRDQVAALTRQVNALIRLTVK